MRGTKALSSKIKLLVPSRSRTDIDQLSDEMKKGFAALADQIKTNKVSQEEIEQKDRRFQQAYDELQMFKSGLNATLLRPYIDQLIALFEACSDGLTAYNARYPSHDDIRESETYLLQAYNRIPLLITRSLARLKIQRADASVNAVFDPEIHECVDVKDTDDPRQDNRIAEEYEAGWLDRESGCRIKCARVSVYRFVDNTEEAN